MSGSHQLLSLEEESDGENSCQGLDYYIMIMIHQESNKKKQSWVPGFLNHTSIWTNLGLISPHLIKANHHFDHKLSPNVPYLHKQNNSTPHSLCHTSVTNILSSNHRRALSSPCCLSIKITFIQNVSLSMVGQQYLN